MTRDEKATPTYVCHKCGKEHNSAVSLNRHLYGYVCRGKPMKPMCTVSDDEFLRDGKCIELRRNLKRRVTERECDEATRFIKSTRFPKPNEDEPSEVDQDDSTEHSEDHSIEPIPSDAEIEAITDLEEAKTRFKRAVRAWRHERDEPARKRKRRVSSPHETYLRVKKQEPLDMPYAGRGLEEYDTVNGRKRSRQSIHAVDERKATRLSGHELEARIPIRVLGELDYYKAAQGEETIYRMLGRDQQAGKAAPSQYLPFVKAADGSWERVTHKKMRKMWSVLVAYRLQQKFPKLVPPESARPKKSTR